MSQRVLVVVLLVLLGQAWAVDCDQWGTTWSWMREFFEVATLEEVRGCLSAGADANAIAIDAPLHWAASGDPAIVALLIEHGADVNVRGVATPPCIGLGTTSPSSPSCSRLGRM